MKVHGTNQQQMIELQRAILIRTQEEQRYAKIIEDAARLRKKNAANLQQARTERNRRLENSKGQTIDIDC